MDLDSGRRAVCERKVLRTLFGPGRDVNDGRYNHELYNPTQVALASLSPSLAAYAGPDILKGSRIKLNSENHLILEENNKKMIMKWAETGIKNSGT